MKTYCKLKVKGSWDKTFELLVGDVVKLNELLPELEVQLRQFGNPRVTLKAGRARALLAALRGLDLGESGTMSYVRSSLGNEVQGTPNELIANLIDFLQDALNTIDSSDESDG